MDELVKRAEVEALVCRRLIELDGGVAHAERACEPLQAAAYEQTRDELREVRDEIRALPSATPSEVEKPGGIKLFEADIPPHKLMIFSAGKVYVFDTETGDMQEDSIANVYARAELATKDTSSSARQAQRESWLRGEMALGLDGLQLCRSCRRHRATLSHKDTGDE